MSQGADSDQIQSPDEQSQDQIVMTKKTKKTNTKNKGKIILNISDCQYPVVSRVAKGFGWKLQSNSEAQDWDVFWTDNAVQAETLCRMEPYQKINHFPGMFNLARKNLMGRYLMKMRKKFAQDYAFFPMTWMLPVQYHELKAYFQTKQKGKARTFIVKPEALSQGKGIFLTRKLEQIDQNAHCVVQRYMHRPYLIQGLKFDMRVYVLVASVDPLRLYIYHEGLTRFATQKYEAPTRDNMQDVCMHLTNYAINKDNPKFVFNNSSTDMTKGHKRSLTWLFQYLQKNEPKNKNLKQQIQDMIVKTMISGLPVITNTYRSCQPENFASNMCFQLLGFDVMLTDKGEPVLLEINHTPSFTTDTPLDDLIKTNYIRDSLSLMNINQKTKQSIVKDRRQACQQRVITGKKVRLSNQEKEIQRKKAHLQRDKYQNKHIGGFKKIFPLQDEEKMQKYQQFLNYSQEMFLTSTGTKKASSVSKKAQKIQSAFGTCFKPKQITKVSTILKSRTSGTQIQKKIAVERKYETKKLIGESSIETQKTKIAHSQNLIPKDFGQFQNGQIKLSKGISLGSQNDEILKEHSESEKQLGVFLKNNNKNYNFKGENTKAHSFNNLLKKAMNEQAQRVEIIQQETEQSHRMYNISNKQHSGIMSSQISKSQQTKNKVRQNSTPKQINSQRQKQTCQRITNNAQFFEEVYPSNYAIKRKTQQGMDACNTTSNRKNEQLKLGIFGVNQITCDGEKKKPKVPNNPKGTLNIQNWQTKIKERELCNREKIPILLNTLLIGSSDGSKPAVSVNNLRKILNNQK